MIQRKCCVTGTQWVGNLHPKDQGDQEESPSKLQPKNVTLIDSDSDKIEDPQPYSSLMFTLNFTLKFTLNQAGNKQASFIPFGCF